MNDESIKEILDKLKNSKWEQDTEEIAYKTLFSNEVYKLLDYITNLKQENERLKEENKHIFANVNDDELLRSNAMNWAEAQDYKSRIEKAIEYIENTPLYETTYDYNMEEELEIQNVSDETASNKLLNILNGRSDE